MDAIKEMCRRAIAYVICLVVYWWFLRSRPKKRLLDDNIINERERVHYIIGMSPRATGDKSETAKEVKKKQLSLRDNESHNTIEDIDRVVSHNQVTLDGFETNDVDFDALTCLGGSSNVSTNSKSKKIKKSQEIENEAKGIQEAINNVVRALSEGNSHPSPSEVEVWNILKDLGLNSDQITFAYLYLLEHPDKLRAVLGCPFERRLDIVMRIVFGAY